MNEIFFPLAFISIEKAARGESICKRQLESIKHFIVYLIPHSRDS